jgi:hypothetical protein
MSTDGGNDEAEALTMEGINEVTDEAIVERIDKATVCRKN